MAQSANSGSMWDERSGFISAKQAARMLGLHPNTLCKWRISGTGPRYIKAGRTVKYRVTEIENWLGNRTFSHTAQYKIWTAGRPTRSRSLGMPSSVELPTKGR
jgi:predicted DNA-binding transcriptional regulator AlpA